MPTEEEKKLLTSNRKETFELLQRIFAGNILICTKKYNETNATSACNHCIKTIKEKFYLVDKIIRFWSNSDIYFLVNEFLNCTKVPIQFDNTHPTHANFNYIFHVTPGFLFYADLSPKSHCFSYCFLVYAD